MRPPGKRKAEIFLKTYSELFRIIKEEVMCRNKKYLISPLKIRYFLDENRALTPYEIWMKLRILFLLPDKNQKNNKNFDAHLDRYGGG
jgi:hypothetical protein